MTFALALPRLRFAVPPVKTLTFRRADGSRLVRVRSKTKGKPKARRGATGDANVALIMAVMMSLVFGPVIGVHLIAAFAPGVAAPGAVARVEQPTLPPG